MIRDVTARRQAEEALGASEQRFRSLVESLHVGIALLGPGAEILYANQSAQKMFNIPIEDVLGKNSSELGLVAVYEDGTEMPFDMRPGPRAFPPSAFADGISSCFNGGGHASSRCDAV